MKPIVVVLLALAIVSVLAGCGTTKQQLPQIQTKIVVVDIPETFYNCPEVQKPNPSTATNKQVGAYITGLVKANKVCRLNMGSIKQFNIDAKKSASGVTETK